MTQAPKIGTRIEIPVHYDLWMRGARFGVVSTGVRSGKPGQSDYFYVKLDNLSVKRSLKIWRSDWDYIKTI